MQGEDFFLIIRFFSATVLSIKSSDFIWKNTDFDNSYLHSSS